MSHDDIVEVYSAANLIESQYLTAALKKAGIQSREVGESLGQAAGCLPLGEASAIRIWVHEADEVRAQEVIQSALEKPRPKNADFGRISAKSKKRNPRKKRVKKRGGEKPPSPARGLLFAAGLLCMLIGSGWAALNWITLRTYTGTTRARLVSEDRKMVFESGDPNIPGQRASSVSTLIEAYYSYDVDGIAHSAFQQLKKTPPRHITIQYVPASPSKYLIEPVTPPWVILLVAVLAGGFAVVLGYKTA
jgi:hypothetical protein